MSQLRVISTYLVLVITILMLSFWAGCGVSLPDARLGEYRYVYRQYYTGANLKVIPIWVDKNFPAVDLLAIEKAVNQWNFVLNGYIRLEVADVNFDMEVDKIQEQQDRQGWLFMKIQSDNKIIPDQDDPKYKTIGFVDQIGGNHLYLVRDRLYDRDVFGVTLHEIGHLLGSPHRGNRLMHPYYTQANSQCIDWISMNEVAHFQGLPVNRLNYCVDEDSAQHDMADGSTAMKCFTVN